MVIMVSGRTDIPAFYSDWFFKRLEDGYVNYKNPYYGEQIHKVSLLKEDVTCFIFCSKNPKPFIKYLDKLDGYSYLFHYSLTSYSTDIEKNVPKGTDRISTFIELSNKIGKERLIWRYDPIIITNKYTVDYHCKMFEKLASLLHKHTTRVVISFIDLFKKVVKNMSDIDYQKNIDDMKSIGKSFGAIANKYGLSISTCAEEINFTEYGFSGKTCVSHDDIASLTGNFVYPIEYSDKRDNCRCVKSIDIGQYNTCMHFCKYCYANDDLDDVKENCKKHNKDSNILIGESVDNIGARLKRKDRNLFNL